MLAKWSWRFQVGNEGLVKFEAYACLMEYFEKR